MKHRATRGLVWLMMTLGGASLFQTFPITGGTGAGGGGCQTFATNGALTSVDLCQIFDCESGFLGGAIQPCGDPGTVEDDMFLDCRSTAG